MIYRSLACLCFVLFYATYFVKLLKQKKKGIVTDQLGKGTGKSKTFYIEIILKIVTVIAATIDAISIILGRSYLGIMWKAIGLYFAFSGGILLILATFFMKDNWRAGVAKEENDRSLVTNGIYKFSRNPAFLGFDFCYIGFCLMYCNPFTIGITILGIVGFHIQILEEEKYLAKKFGEEYSDYKKNVSRYLGFGKPTFKKLVCVIYIVIAVWSAFYLVTLLAYAGPTLSWIWIWILIGGYAVLRFVMLYREIKGIGKFRIPKTLYVIYLCFVTLCLIFFTIVEVNVVKAMTAKPKENLSYVIVLGAGLNGTRPSNPLVKRIEKAAEYMSDNPDTILIASGGQGMFESISEAECIKNELVKKGVDESRIILEDKSTSTEENLRFSMKIIGDADADVGIITNSFHEYRAGLIAKREGYTNYYSVPAVTLFPVGVHYMLREFFGVVRLMI